MKFLEAKKAIRNLQAGVDCRVHLFSSAQLENLSPFFEAYCAHLNFRSTVAHTPFDTLSQSLLESPIVRPELGPISVRVLVLFPWDFCPQLNWRGPVSTDPLSFNRLKAQVDDFVALLRVRAIPGVFVNADVPRILASDDEQHRLERYIRVAAMTCNFAFLENQYFSLESFARLGRPFSNSVAVAIAEILSIKVYSQIEESFEPKKVLITDLDNTVWSGVVGEDGVDGVFCSPEGRGIAHYWYQLALKQLHSRGVLLVAVSRNDIDLARAPFEQAKFPLTLDSFHSIRAGYGKKSNQIELLSNELSLPVESFVFVDDNPVEIAEVKSEVPEIMCLRFPDNVEEFPAWLNRMLAFFRSDEITIEDLQRDKLYKIRALANVEKAESKSLESYLSSLNMTLHINVKVLENRSRAIQLINKTNQFNLNGIRFSDSEVDDVIACGGSLISVRLVDKFGDHGDIMACLIDVQGNVISWVMSCRVLQRDIENTFLRWLFYESNISVQSLNYQETLRNLPVFNFLSGLLAITDFGADSKTVDVSVIKKSLCVDSGYHQVRLVK